MTDEDEPQFDPVALRGEPEKPALVPGAITVVPKMEHLQDGLTAVLGRRIQELLDLQKDGPLPKDEQRELHKLIDSYTKLERAERERAKLDRSKDASDEELENFVEEYARNKGWKVEK